MQPRRRCDTRLPSRTAASTRQLASHRCCVGCRACSIGSDLSADAPRAGRVLARVRRPAADCDRTFLALRSQAGAAGPARDDAEIEFAAIDVDVKDLHFHQVAQPEPIALATADQAVRGRVVMVVVVLQAN